MIPVKIREQPELPECANAEMVKLPPRSAELNPVENIFKVVCKDLHTVAKEKQIEQESFTELWGIHAKKGVFLALK